MVKAFPNGNTENSLLSPGLLEQFVLERPKTLDEWFRKISQASRTSVELEQVGRYLDRVLELIAECDA